MQGWITIMNEPVTWLIIALFYAPLHYLPPALIVFMGSEGGERRARLTRTLVDCSVSMVASLGTVIWLVGNGHMAPAMGIMLLSMGLPYVRLLLHRRR